VTSIILTTFRRFERVLRYLMVGAGVTAIYSLIVAGLIITDTIEDPTLATVIGSIAAAPVSFMAHRFITYSDVSDDPAHWKRFAIITLASFAIVTASMKLVDILHGPFWAGLIVGWIVVPIVNFLINTVWVFRATRLLALAGTDQSTATKEQQI
tara:strand:+ start:33411 stop:33872 length:462 start_codon:yes stop_codon:yes gene_type:complete